MTLHTGDSTRCPSCGQRLDAEKRTAEIDALRGVVSELRGVLLASVTQQSHEPIREWADRQRRSKPQ